MAIFKTLAEAVAENLKDGDTVAFEGFTHLIPHAAAHEAIRQGRKELTLIRMTPDMVYDQMIGMGMAKKLVFSYAGNPGVGLLRRLRDAVENGWPNRIEIEEHSHAAMANAYEAGAAGLPWRCSAAITAPACLRSIRTSGPSPARSPARSWPPFRRCGRTSSFIHAQKADRKGNVLIEGIVGVQKEAVLAARRAVVTVEEIVEDFDDVHPNACILPHWTITAISQVPGGAHPSYAHGYYERDNAAYLEWDKIAADRDVFAAWMKENVLDSTPEAFAGRVARLRSKA